MLFAGLLPASKFHRGGVEEAQGLSYAEALLRYSGGTKGGRFERIEIVGAVEVHSQLGGTLEHSRAIRQSPLPPDGGPSS